MHSIQSYSRTHFVLAIGLLITMFVFGQIAQAGDKVTICHHTNSEKNPIVVISVNAHAFDAHMGHGDSLYDSVNGCEEGGGGPAPL